MEEMATVDQDVLPVYVAKPALLLVQVLVDGLPIFIDGDWLAALGVALFKVILNFKPALPAEALLDFLINEGGPTFGHGEVLLLSMMIVEPKHG